MRNFRRAVEPAILIKRRAEAKRVAAIQFNNERYVQETYEQVNLDVVKSSCAEFKKSNPHCRICQFFSTRKQVEKFGVACPIWLKVFGIALRKAVWSLTVEQGVKIPEVKRFITIWNARK